MNENLHLPHRRVIELRMEHADLNDLIDSHVTRSPQDDLVLRRLKKRRLVLRDELARLQAQLEPPEPA